MAACKEFRDRLLDPDDAQAALHAQSCDGCRAEAAALREALASVALAPPSAEERASLRGLSPSVLSAGRRAAVRRTAWQRLSGAGLVAAAAAVLVLVPTVLKSRSAAHPTPATQTSPATLEADTDPVEATGVAFADEDGADWTDDDADGADL